MITPLQYREMILRSEGRQAAPTPAEAVEREADLHADVLEFCKNKGWICIHSRMDAPHTNAVGTVDFIVATDDGRTIYAEGKRKGGKVTPAQQAMLHWLERNKQIAGVVHSLDEFIALSRKDRP